MFGFAAEDICELEQARYLFDFDARIVVADGQKMNSYDELVRLAGDDNHRDKEYIEIVLLPAIAGG
jgi:hypothetical protein